MSGDGVHRDGMRGRDDIDGEALDQLRQGRTPEGRPDLEALASLLTDLRRAHRGEPAPPMGPELTELVATGAARDDRAVDPQTTGSSTSGWAGRAKLLIGGAVAGLGLVGGLGAAGALPAPVQRAVASTADVVGLDFPRPPRPTPPPPDPARSPDAPAPPPASSTTTTCPPATAPAASAPSSPAPSSPGGGDCGATSTSTSAPTSTSTTSRSGPTTTRVERPTTTTRRGSTTTAPRATSTSTPARR